MARRYPESVTNDELRAEAERLGSPIQSENLRSSLWNHVRRNWLERIENGVYRITRDGAAAAGVQIQPFSATGQSEPGREHVFQ